MFGFRGKAERQPENNPDEPDAWNGGGLLNGRFLAYQARDVLGNLTKSESFKVLVGNDTVEKAKVYCLACIAACLRFHGMQCPLTKCVCENCRKCSRKSAQTLTS